MVARWLNENWVFYKWLIITLAVGAILSVVISIIQVNKEAVGAGKVTMHDYCAMPDEACLSSPDCQEKAPGYEASSCNCPCLLVLPAIVPFGQRLNQLIKQNLVLGLGVSLGIGLIIADMKARKKREMINS